MSLNTGAPGWVGVLRASGFNGWTSRSFSGGKYDGEMLQELATRAEAGLAWHPAFGWRLSAGLGYHEASFSGAISPILPAEKQRYLAGSGSVRWGSGEKSAGVDSLSLELKTRGMHALDGVNPNVGSFEGRADSSMALRGIGVLTARLGAGVLPDFAPANYWYTVGGFSPLPLRGHATLYGTRYLSGTLELQRALGRGFTLAIFADAAQVWQQSDLPGPGIPVGVGVGAIYRASMGPPVRLDVAADPAKGTFGWKMGVAGSF